MASKTYILDTSVIIDNPDCIGILRNGEENRILIPYAVLLELDRLKRKQDLSYIVADIAAKLEDDPLIEFIKHDGVVYNDEDTGDELILEDIVRYLDGLTARDRKKTFVVSNDRFFRIRLRHAGLAVQEFKSSQPIVSESEIYTGFIEAGEEPAPNSFAWVDGKPQFNGRTPRLVDHENRPWGVIPRTVYQNLAAELMLDPDIDIVSVQSQAGYGKTYLALACALELVLGKPRLFDKLYIVKPNVEIGEKLGFLPGQIEEKLQPYYKPIEDLLLKLHEARPANRLFEEVDGGFLDLNPKKCEILPLNYLRGMNLEDCVVIVDEAQNLTRLQTRTLLTRMGHGVKCFVLGDTEQVDHPYLNRYNNGLNWIVKKFRGSWNYGHIVLKGAKSRGPITDLVLKTNL
jgi:PhoH-like ATPase